MGEAPKRRYCVECGETVVHADEHERVKAQRDRLLANLKINRRHLDGMIREYRNRGIHLPMHANDLASIDAAIAACEEGSDAEA